MSKNVNVNGVDYSGVSQVQLKTTAGGTALFKDVDEITTPSGSINITENGTHDVSSYAQAVVNVESSGGNESYYDQFIGLVDSSISGDIVLPSTVTEIRDYLFQSCINLTGLSMPEVIKIGNYAFSGCENLVLSELPAGIKEIGNWAFSTCRKIGITEIPETVEKIGSYVFYNANLPMLTLKGTPTEIGKGAFSGVSTLNVPWAEGDVAGAPWGATTVNYNYTGA